LPIIWACLSAMRPHPIIANFIEFNKR
jgi:hypothetical protein